MPHSITAILRAFRRATMSVSAARVKSGSMPRSASLAPSSTMTPSVPSGTDQSSRSRPPDEVSPDTPALIMSTAMPLACKAFCSLAGNASWAGRPRPALKESPRTTSLIGLAARLRLSGDCAIVIKASINTAMCMKKSRHASRPRVRSCHMTGPWTVASNPLARRHHAGHHRHLQRQSLARDGRGARSHPQGYQPARRLGRGDRPDRPVRLGQIDAADGDGGAGAA